MFICKRRQTSMTALAISSMAPFESVPSLLVVHFSSTRPSRLGSYISRPFSRFAVPICRANRARCSTRLTSNESISSICSRSLSRLAFWFIRAIVPRTPDIFSEISPRSYIGPGVCAQRASRGSGRSFRPVLYRAPLAQDSWVVRVE